MIYGFYEEDHVINTKRTDRISAASKKQKSGNKTKYNKKIKTLFKLSLVLMLIDIVFTYFILHYFGFQELNNVISRLYNMTPSGLLIFLWCPLVYVILKFMSKFFLALKLANFYRVVLLYYIVANVVAITNNVVQFGMVVV